MGTYGTFTGVVRWYDADTQTGYILSLKDGEVQASMVGDGITAANDNIVLDENGFIVHDFSNASIITPIFGVGLTQDVLRNAEDFAGWGTFAGTASVTANTHVSPDGKTQNADTINLPAVDDYILQSTAEDPLLEAGQNGIFSVWLKASSAGTIRLRASRPIAGMTECVADVAVTTQWRRCHLVFTNDTAGSIAVNISIRRATVDQLSQVVAWGAQVTYGVSRAVPYWPYHAGGGLENGMYVLGQLGISGHHGEVVIGSNWTILPTGTNAVAIGYSAGHDSTGARLIALGRFAGRESDGTDVIAIGYQTAGYSRSNVILLGPYASPTADNQVVLGSSNVEYTDLYGGGGVTQSTPAAFALHATGGSGTNIAGAALKLAGGQGTGTGAGGSVIIQTAPAGSSGSSLNTLADRLIIDSSGRVGINVTPSHQLEITNAGAAQHAIKITAASSQSAYIVLVNSNAGSALFGIDELGRFRIGTSSTHPNKFYITGSDSISNSVSEAYVYLKNTLATASGHANIMLDRGNENAVSSFGFLAAGSTNFEVGDYANHLFLRDVRGVYVFFARWQHGIPADTIYGAATYTRFNDGANDYDFIFEGDTATELLRMDAGLDAVQIGTTTAGAIADFRSAAIVFNEDGANRDIRFEGDTDANNFFSDASTDRIGIGTSTPAYKLDIAGSVNISTGSVYRVNGTQVVTAQQAAIADTTNTADVGVQLNKVIAAMRAHGLIAT